MPRMTQEISRVRKTGNSRGVVIPAKMWKALGWRDMDVVVVSAESTVEGGGADRLVITRVDLKKAAEGGRNGG